MIEEKNLILPKRNLSPITDYYSRNIQTKQWIDMCQQSREGHLPDSLIFCTLWYNKKFQFEPNGVWFIEIEYSFAFICKH